MKQNIYDEDRIKEQLLDPEEVSNAFSLIVKEYSEQLYWQIRRLVLSHDDANDILQDTFLKAWNNIQYFRGDAKISTWLYKIALNESLAFLNKAKAENNISLDDEDAVIANKLEGDSYFNGDETAVLLQKALYSLPEKQRIVFNLKYYQEMKYEDMSDILGTSVGALKASYHLAVKKIENYFKERL